MSATLGARRAATIVVTRPERIVVDETRRLIDTLERKQMKIETIVANYLTPENDCKCDQSMRAHELAELARLGDFVPVVRADTPVTRLAALATLFRVESD